MKRGRRTKLTPETQERIVELIERGYTMKSAAHHCGVREWSLYYWIRRGESNPESELSHFSQSVRAALEKRKTVEIQASGRSLARARYEQNKSAEQIALLFAEKIVEMASDGRVPWNVAITGAGIAIDELERKLDDEAPSWVEDHTPFYANYRARMEDDE